MDKVENAEIECSKGGLSLGENIYTFERDKVKKKLQEGWIPKSFSITKDGDNVCILFVKGGNK